MNRVQYFLVVLARVDSVTKTFVNNELPLLGFLMLDTVLYFGLLYLGYSTEVSQLF